VAVAYDLRKLHFNPIADYQ